MGARPYPLTYNGKNVLVVGMGPAGYTLAHFLVNEGFGVVGVDGLKVEPFEEDLVGSADKPPKPRDYLDLLSALHALMRELRSKSRSEVESHFDNPKDSEIFKGFPKLLANADLVTFKIAGQDNIWIP